MSSQPVSQPTEPYAYPAFSSGRLKRKRDWGSRGRVIAGAGPILRRHRGANVPPGRFAHAPLYMPRRYRRNGVKYQRNRRRGRSKYPRAGSSRIAMRPRMGAIVPTEVKKTYVESAQQVWPQGVGAGTPPSRSPVYCPFTYQFWNRGISNSQFTGDKITLKNISVMLQLVPPVNIPTANNKPYRLRITQGWCKQNPSVDMQPTTANPVLSSAYPHGMAMGQIAPVPQSLLRGGANVATEPPHIATLLKAQADFVGFNGGHQNEASFPKTMYMILSDTTTTLAPLTETAGAAGTVDRQFADRVFKYNWTCNKPFRLSAMSTHGGAPAANAEWFSPVNVPGDWVPFLSIGILNATADYTSTAHMPTVKFSENTFYLDN